MSNASRAQRREDPHAPIVSQSRSVLCQADFVLTREPAVHLSTEANDLWYIRATKMPRSVFSEDYWG